MSTSIYFSAVIAHPSVVRPATLCTPTY